jgi:hypothetical protein
MFSAQAEGRGLDLTFSTIAMLLRSFHSHLGIAPMSRPLFAVLAIALGLPFLILLALVSSATGVSASVFTSAVGIVVMSVSLMLVIYEIKRIADLPPDAH